MKFRSLMLPLAFLSLLAGCAGVQPKPVEAKLPPPLPQAPQIVFKAPDGWLFRQGQLPNGIDIVELLRLDTEGVLVAQAAIMSQPSADVDVPKAIDDLAKAVADNGGAVIIGNGPNKPTDRIGYVIPQGKVTIVGVVVFKPSVGVPGRTIIIEGRWLSELTEVMGQEVRAIIESAELK